MGLAEFELSKTMNSPQPTPQPIFGLTRAPGSGFLAYSGHQVAAKRAYQADR